MTIATLAICDLCGKQAPAVEHKYEVDKYGPGYKMVPPVGWIFVSLDPVKTTTGKHYCSPTCVTRAMEAIGGHDS